MSHFCSIPLGMLERTFEITQYFEFVKRKIWVQITLGSLDLVRKRVEVYHNIINATIFRGKTTFLTVIDTIYKKNRENFTPV